MRHIQPTSWLKIFPNRVQTNILASRGISQLKFSDSLAYKLLQFKRFVENNLLQLIILAAVIIGLIVINALSGEPEEAEVEAEAEQQVVYKSHNNTNTSAVAGDVEEKVPHIDKATIAALVRKVENVDTNKVDVESTALQLIQNSEWENETIIALAHSWITLSKSKQFIYKQSVWFQLLENTLINKLKQEESSNASDAADEHRELLSSLALQLSIEIPPEQEQEQKAEVVASSAAPEVKKEDPDEFVDLNAFADAPVDDSSDIIPLNQIVRGDSPPVAVKPTVVENVIDSEAIKRKQAQKITSREVRNITNQFVDYYQSGNIDQFTALFSEDVLSNDVNDLTGLEKEYGRLFSTTASRKMIVHNLNWTFKDNQADGKGNMIVNIQVGSEEEPSIFQGKIRFVLEKKEKQIRITQFFHEVQ